MKRNGSMSELVKAEVQKILALLFLLAVGAGYLMHIVGDSEPRRAQDGAALYYDGTAVDSLRHAIEGRAAPIEYTYNLTTGRRHTFESLDDGMLAILPLSGCISQLAETLRGIQSLYSVMGGNAMLKVVLVDSSDAQIMRIQALRLQKALRPTFEILYSDDTNAVLQLIKSKRVEAIFFIENRVVAKVLHVSEAGKIADAVSDFRLDVPLRSDEAWMQSTHGLGNNWHDDYETVSDSGINEL